MKNFQKSPRALTNTQPFFLSCLTEATRKYTNLDPASPEGTTLLNVRFITQPIPDSRHKLQKLDDDPQLNPTNEAF